MSSKKILGIDPGTGNEIFIKKDGSLTNTWSEEDYVPYKTTSPTLAGTFGINAIWKEWELNANFYYRFGGYAYNQTLVDKTTLDSLQVLHLCYRIQILMW